MFYTINAGVNIVFGRISFRVFMLTFAAPRRHSVNFEDRRDLAEVDR